MRVFPSLHTTFGVQVHLVTFLSECLRKEAYGKNGKFCLNSVWQITSQAVLGPPVTQADTYLSKINKST